MTWESRKQNSLTGLLCVEEERTLPERMAIRPQDSYHEICLPEPTPEQTEAAVAPATVSAAAPQAYDASRQMKHQLQQPEQGKIDLARVNIALERHLLGTGREAEDGVNNHAVDLDLNDDGVARSAVSERAIAYVDYTLWQELENRCLSGYFQQRVEYNHDGYMWHMSKKRIFGRTKNHKNCSSCIASYVNSCILWKEFLHSESDWAYRHDVVERHVAAGRQSNAREPELERGEEALDICKASVEEYGACREPLRWILATLRAALSPNALATGDEIVIEHFQE
ncbi:hypothetical protein PV08_05776 [Exophiala spinifera]|uniref:Uncharacterized protein n=1 Tax=Exophiala spinifera TaxID=91928 RepID=A0A0D1YL10_9EURO|nr:uncharacterized protein PV08_05776 [Exophiala spinifera]KIW15726.1 hypothetical protein PV08_05776 [Exophiala spinifera]